MADAEILVKKILFYCWRRETHKITCFIISQLFEYSLEIVGKQGDKVRNALLSLDLQIFLDKERNI